jgi:hypothetical protein
MAPEATDALGGSAKWERDVEAATVAVTAAEDGEQAGDGAKNTRERAKPEESDCNAVGEGDWENVDEGGAVCGSDWEGGGE